MYIQFLVQCLALNGGQRLLAFIFIIFRMLVYWKGVYILFIYLRFLLPSFIYSLLSPPGPIRPVLGYLKWQRANQGGLHGPHSSVSSASQP